METHGESAALIAADEAHYCVRCAVAKITGLAGPAAAASPPTYQLGLERLSGLLGRAWERSAAPEVERAVVALLALHDEGSFTTKRGRDAEVRRILTDLETGLAERGNPLLPEEVAPLARYLHSAYRLGKTDVARELGWSVSMRLVDQDAVAGLTANGVWWVGKTSLSGTARSLLQEAALEALEGGLGRREAGAVFAARVGHLQARSADYWEGFAAVYLTRSRSFGALSAMAEMGGRTYRYENPLDERTSDVCRQLAGTEFTVRDAIRLRDRLLGSSDPEAWKAIAPWPKASDVLGADGSTLPADELLRRGIAMPPLHMHCRSVIDVEEFESEEAIPDPPLPPVEKPTPKPRKPRAPRPVAPEVPPPPQRVSDSPAARKQAFVDARAALEARGINADLAGFGTATRVAAKRAGVSLGMAADLSVAVTPDQFALMAIDADKRGHEDLKAALNADYRAQRDYIRAAAQWFAVATPAERRAAQREYVAGMIPAGRGLTPAQRAEFALVVADSVDHWDPELLLYLRRSGTVISDIGGKRAYCSPNGPRGGPEPFVDRDIMTDPKHPQRRYARQTAAHEIGHALDMVLGGKKCGQPWRTAALEDLGRSGSAWERGIGATFTQLKAAGGNKPYFMGDPQKRSQYAWRGDWVDPYEARIYSGQVEPDMVGWADAAAASGGPIEFIAQQQTYVRAAIEISRGRPLHQMVQLSIGQPWRKAVAQYPAAYVQGMDELYGSGRAHLREAIAADLIGKTDRERVASLVVAHVYFGVPLDEAAAAIRPTLKNPDGLDLEALRAALPAEGRMRVVFADDVRRGIVSFSRR